MLFYLVKQEVFRSFLPLTRCVHNNRSRLDVEKGTYVKVAVNHEVVHLLSDASSCVEREEEDPEPVSGGTFDDCMYDRLREVALEEVGCTVPWLKERGRVCLEEEQRRRAFANYQKNRRNQVYLPTT